MVRDLREELDYEKGEMMKIAGELALGNAFLTSLYRSSGGGGNPEEPFLQNVCNRHYDKKVDYLIDSINIKDAPEFKIIKECIEELERKNKKKGQKLDKFLTPKRVNCIATKIRELGPADSDRCWEMMATNMGYQGKQLKRFRASVRINHQYSPCDALFSHSRSYHPDRPLFDVFQAMPGTCKKIMAAAMIDMLHKT